MNLPCVEDRTASLFEEEDDQPFNIDSENSEPLNLQIERMNRIEIPSTNHSSLNQQDTEYLIQFLRVMFDRKLISNNADLS